MRRVAALLVVSLVVGVAGLAGPAGAAGTGDVELVPAPRDGQVQTSFRVRPSEDALSFQLVNLADQPRTVRLYAASADRSAGGGIGVGAVGSAPWLDLPEGEITLKGSEARTVTVPLDGDELAAGREQLGAIVLEAPQGAVTVRVATLVTVEPRSALPLPLWAVALAVISLALATFGLWVAWRRRRQEREEASAAAPAALAETTAAQA